MIQNISTIAYDPTSALPVPVVTVRLAKTHGRLMDSADKPETITWCGRRLAISADLADWQRPLRGVADSVAAVDCRSCRRSRPASWNWGHRKSAPTG